MTRPVLFLGGNGHCAARLAHARAAIVARGHELALVDACYPGFEGRPRAESFDAFLGSIADEARRTRPALVYATGIGGLLALTLRARGELGDAPLLMQGAVLWGLEHRLFARVMRGPMPGLLRLALRTPFARRRFVAKHLDGADPGLARDFFDGYRRCTAFADFFRWLRAPLLRSLEREFAASPGLLEDVGVWWGARDRVVGLDELERTERALDTTFARRTFEAWGHYPMIEDPAGWVEELERAVA